MIENKITNTEESYSWIYKQCIQLINDIRKQVQIFEDYYPILCAVLPEDHIGLKKLKNTLNKIPQSIAKDMASVCFSERAMLTLGYVMDEKGFISSPKSEQI